MAMLYWFSLIHLREVMVNPGCPICQIRMNSARRYMDTLIFEGVNSVSMRLKFWAGLGYCPEHTRLLVELVQKNGEKPTGLNILYESLADVVSEKISTYPIPTRRSGYLQKLLQRLLPGRSSAGASRSLEPQSSCRICQVADESALHGLETLMYCLQDQEDKAYRLYLDGDGVCLYHLKMALQQLAHVYPAAAQLMKEHAVNQLRRWGLSMEEYIRKQSWQYHHETVTQAESQALQRALAFFTGCTQDTFTNNSSRNDK